MFASSGSPAARSYSFAALATELLPDVVHRRLHWVTLGGFVLGVVAMLLLQAPTAKLQGPEGAPLGKSLPMSLLVASGADIALYGLLIGTSFAASER